MANIAKGGKEKVTVNELRATLAFLHNTTEEDNRVAMLYKMGLCKKIMVRITQLKPEFCKLCRKDHYTMRGEEATISCLRWGKGACPECYKLEENPTLKKWKYLCESCEVNVEKDMAFGKLDVNDWDSDFEKKRGNKESEKGESPNDGVKEVMDVEETIDLEDECEFASEAAKVQEKLKNKDEVKKKKEEEKTNKGNVSMGSQEGGNTTENLNAPSIIPGSVTVCLIMETRGRWAAKEVLQNSAVTP